MSYKTGVSQQGQWGEHIREKGESWNKNDSYDFWKEIINPAQQCFQRRKHPLSNPAFPLEGQL